MFVCFQMSFSIVKLCVCHLKTFDVLIYVNVSFGTLPVEVPTPFLFFVFSPPRRHMYCCSIILYIKKRVFFLKMSLEYCEENLHMKAFSSSPFSEATKWKSRLNASRQPHLPAHHLSHYNPNKYFLK